MKNKTIHTDRNNTGSDENQSFLITVVTVVFNFKDEMENTILSIVNQSYNNIEYIIIDGGSTDGTLEIIKKFRKKIKILVSEPDSGTYDAMNKSLRLATGDFLIFMNAGDTFFSPNTITNMVKKINKYDSVYYGNAIFTSKTQNLKINRGGPFSKYRLAKENICHQTIFYPKTVFTANNFDLNYKLYSDWYYNIKLFSQIKFDFIDEEVVFFDATGISALNEDQVFKKDRLNIVYKYLGFDAILYLTYNKLRNEFLNLLHIKKMTKE